MKKIISLVLISISIACLFACSSNSSNDIVSQIEKSMTVFDYYENTLIDDMDTVKFGKYPISDINGKKMEDIEWYVLKKDGNEAMLFSKYCLDRQFIHDNSMESQLGLYDWLNNDFAKTVFGNYELLVEKDGRKVSFISEEQMNELNDDGKSLMNNYFEILLGRPTVYNDRSVVIKSNKELNEPNSCRYNIDKDKISFELLNEILNKYNDTKKDGCSIPINTVFSFTNVLFKDQVAIAENLKSMSFADDSVYRYWIAENNYNNYILRSFGHSVSGLLTSKEFGYWYCVRPVIYVKMNGNSNFLTNDEIERQKNESKLMISNSINRTDGENDNESITNLKREIQLVKTINDYQVNDIGITLGEDGEPSFSPSYNNAIRNDIESIKFGKYFYRENDKELSNDMEWIVLEKDELHKKALLLSKNIIDYKPIGYQNKRNYTFWNNSYIRQWLNSIFLNTSFSDIEKSVIVDTPLVTNNNEIINDSKFSIDKIFLLSFNEVKKYFDVRQIYNIWLKPNDPKNPSYRYYMDDRFFSEGTEYEKFVNDNWRSGVDYKKFWLRSNGSRNDGKNVLSFDKPSLEDNGMIGYNYSGIRPAMWVSYGDSENDLNGWIDGYYYTNGKILINSYTPDGKFVNYDGIVVDIEKDRQEINKEEVYYNSWYKTKNNIWYYFERDKNDPKKGWFYEDRDDQIYYLDPTTGVMLTGWQEIDGDMYYFSEEHSASPNWYYVGSLDQWMSYGKKIKSFGSMYRDETTPDGKKVDKDGKLIK